MSQRNNARGSSSRGRGRGNVRGGVPPVPSAPVFSGGMIGGNYVPPPLPVGLQRLIDGKTLMSIRVEYTPSGAHVLAVLPGGETQPLHEFRLARERQTRARELRELTVLFAGRVRDRKIEGVVVPAFQSLQEKETWLGALSADNRKLVEMTNKQFRALKGKDAAAEDAAE